MARKSNDTLILVLVTVGLFALSCAMRFFLADFQKGIGVLPDEIRYLDLASSLFNDGQLVERGGLSSFQKILYPLSLSPAFLVDDPETRVRVIALLNSIYVSSAVFPALVLARRLFTSKAPVIVCLVFTLVMPDMCYSMTFLSECIYLPLVLWLVACCLRALETRGRAGYAWCAGAGLLCYVPYLAKDVALGFALAFIVMMVVRICRPMRYADANSGLLSHPAHPSRDAACGDAKLVPSGKLACLRHAQTVLARPHRAQCVPARDARIHACISLVCFFVTFAIPFIILKLTLFSGLLNSYNQTDPSVLLNPYTLLFSLYAFLSDTTHFVIAFMFFPRVLPALTWPRLTRRERDLYLFCLLAFVFILLIVIYTISIREDLGHVGIRPHVRYVAPLFLPLLFLTIKQLLRGDGAAIMRSPRVFCAAIASTLAVCLLVVFMLGSGDYSQGFDNAQFHVLRLLDDRISTLPIDPGADPSQSAAVSDIYHGALLDINPGTWLAKVLVCAYLLFGMWAVASRRHPGAAVFVPVAIMLVMIANNVGAYQYNDSVYRIEDDEVTEMRLLADFVDGLDRGERVLFVLDDASSAFNNHSDVYIDNRRLNCVYILERQLRSALGAGAIAQKALLLQGDATMGDNIFGANGRTCDDASGIGYIVTPSSQRLRFAPECAQDVTPEGIEDIVIYRVVPDAAIALASPAIEASSSR